MVNPKEWTLMVKRRCFGLSEICLISRAPNLAVGKPPAELVRSTLTVKAVRSCSYSVKFAEGKNITTIEGLSSENDLHPVQQAWIEEIVPQCGYCQPGFMMATAALLEKVPNPTDDDIDNNIVNVCRCATYYRMRKAIHRAAEIKKH